MNRQGKTWRPPTDVYETEDAIVVRVEIAGMHEGDFRIELVRRTLMISGHRVDRAVSPKRSYQQMEIVFGDFLTEAYLPWSIDESGVEAAYRDGLLVVTLPKSGVLHVPIVTVSNAGEGNT